MNNHLTAQKSDAKSAAGLAWRQTVDRVRSKFGRQSRKTFGVLLSLLGVATAGLPLNAGVTNEVSEYDIAVRLSGDQGNPDLALNSKGGYLVWDDNVGDGEGISVNLRRVTQALSGEMNVIPLATKTAGHQEHPRVSLLARGGAAFVWQSGPDGAPRIMTRTMNGSSLFTGEEIAVSARADVNQTQAAIAGLTSGSYVVVWSAYDQDGSMKGVYGAIFGASAQRVGGEFQINQFSKFNQRNAAVAALPGGGFVVTWISEGARGDDSCDVFARIYGANGAVLGNEFRVNTGNNVCSSPTVAVTSTGNFTIAWCESSQDANFNAESENDSVSVKAVRDRSGWDIYASGFQANGGRLSNPSRINQRVQGNQTNPKIATVKRTQLVVWTSFGQDGDLDGVVGRSLNGVGAADGNEFVVNTTAAGRQIHPVVAGNGESRFVVCWTTFTGVETLMDLRAQRFLAEEQAVELPPPSAPVVSALSQSRLSVGWPTVDGYDVQNYELYINGATTPTVVEGQTYVVTGLAPGTTYRFELAYKLRDGQVSPRSPEAIGRSWGEDWNEDGIPDDWQAQFWLVHSALFPSPNADSDGDGVSNRQEFMAGTNPVDANSVLRTTFVISQQGPRLTWNTVPGQIYQVQVTTDFSAWNDFGGLRFAPGTTDSISVPVGNSLGYYRVNRIR